MSSLRGHLHRTLLGALLLSLGPLSCTKVPIISVDAWFDLADATWFSQERTLFYFYRVQADQGIGDPSLVEITYLTDDGRVDWTPVSDLPTVHTHVPVDCGVRALCGSLSLAVPLEPREVGIRLRYHPDGELGLYSDTVFNVVGPGLPHTNRSLLIYGVLDQSNERVQWRGRHVFPTLRNEQVSELGLRRDFTIEAQRYGQLPSVVQENPYGYGLPCEPDMAPFEIDPVFTNERAIFNDRALPVDAFTASGVCANATVTDATGTFTTRAFARKNPEVRPAFPELRSPTHDARPLRFYLGPCDRVISEPHEAMQRQRLFMEGVPTYCTDDWQQPTFVPQLVVDLRDAVEAARPDGEDMVLVVGLQEDEDGLSEAIEAALVQVVPAERHRSTPRLVGAFVFDSVGRRLSLSELAPSTLWCPSQLPVNGQPDASSQSCPVLPALPDLNLGPFSFDSLPILPTREKYLDFINNYSDAQAGEATAIHFIAPEFATTSDHVDFGVYGTVTFLNGERVTASPEDAFSYCVVEGQPNVVFRSELMRDPAFLDSLVAACDAGQLPDAFCAIPDVGLLDIEWLADWHNMLGERAYELGLFWDFPFLFRMEYKAVLAGSLTAFGLSVPFGVGGPQQTYYGTDLWDADVFSLEKTLTQCRRFCDAPTFDSAGVYHVTDGFRDTYARACYLPAYPAPGDSGFPYDP